MPTSPPTPPDRSSIVSVALAVIVGLSAVVVGATAAVAHAPPPGDPAGAAAVDPTDSPTEDEYAQEVPEEGDPYFEAAHRDGDWVSYVNPRDEYRSPYLGDGSGKLCVTLLNEEGEVIVGESVPNTSVSVPTGDAIEWHTSADPFTVEFPMTDHYDRPLDADQFGTDDDLPQGDGYLDSHCIEFHGLPENETIEYGEAEVEGEYADRIEVVGYHQVENEAWDTDVDPLEDAVSYEEAGGGWTYEPDGSHGQAMVVLQLDPPEDDPTENETEVSGTDGDEDENDGDGADADDGDDPDDSSDELPGFGAPAAVAAVGLVAVLATVRSRRRR